MSNSDAYNDMKAFLNRWLSPTAKYIFLANTGVFLFQLLILPLTSNRVQNLYFLYLSERPYLAIYRGMIWQFVTYMFIHGGVFHFIFNMFVLWFFAPRLEYRWGSPRFFRFYFIVGIGAGLFHAVISIISGRQFEGIIGASGALYGILLAYALYWPDDIVYVWGVIPVKVKVLVIIMGFLAFMGSVRTSPTGISHITHFGGLVIAYFYLKGPDIMNQITGKGHSSRYGSHRDRFSDRDMWR